MEWGRELKSIDSPTEVCDTESVGGVWLEGQNIHMKLDFERDGHEEGWSGKNLVRMGNYVILPGDSSGNLGNH